MLPKGRAHPSETVEVQSDGQTNGQADGRAIFALPYPFAPEAASLFAADVRGLRAVERHARRAHRYLIPWRRNPPFEPKIVWRLSGNALDRSARCDRWWSWPQGAQDAAEAVYGAVNCPDLRRESNGYPGAYYQVAAALCWRAAARLGKKVPARSVRVSPITGRPCNIFFPKALVGQPFASLKNPFAPLAAIWMLGYGVREMTSALVQLYAPLGCQPQPSKHQIKRGLVPPRFLGEVALRKAVISRELETVRRLLGERVDVNSQDSAGRAPLHYAFHLEGQTVNVQNRFLELLLSAGSELNLRDHRGQTAAHTAAFANAENVLKGLLARGADPNIQGDDGRAPLHIAAALANPRLVAALLNAGAAPDSRGPFDETPLFVAARRGATDVVSLLMRSGADPEATTCCDWTVRKITQRLRRPAHQHAIETLLGRPKAVQAKIASEKTLENWPEALEQAIHEDPKSGAWQVLSDWLLEWEDPRGVAIALGLKCSRARGLERWKLECESKRFALKHAAVFQRSLHQADPLCHCRHPGELSYRMRWGFVDKFSCTISHSTRAFPAALLNAEAMRFVVSMSLATWSGTPSLDKVIKQAAPKQSLRRLRLQGATPALLKDLERFAPRLQTLTLGAKVSLPDKSVHPNLETLILKGAERLQCPEKLETRLPKLQCIEVSLAHMAIAYNAFYTALDGGVLRVHIPPRAVRAIQSLKGLDWSRLERLELRCIPQTIESLLAQMAPIIAQAKRVWIVCPSATDQQRQKLSELRVPPSVQLFAS